MTSVLKDKPTLLTSVPHILHIVKIKRKKLKEKQDFVTCYSIAIKKQNKTKQPSSEAPVNQLTYISGFAIEGVLRRCLQRPNVEHWVGLSVSTGHTNSTSTQYYMPAFFDIIVL